MLLAFLVSTAFALDDAALTGDYRLAEARDVVQTRVDAAVDGAIATFNLAIRTIARPALGSLAVFCDAYRMTTTADSFAIACDGKEGTQASFGAAPVAATGSSGRSAMVSATRDAAAVVLTFAGDEGHQVVRYEPRADGTLRVDKLLHSDRLDRDVAWTMTYRRP